MRYADIIYNDIAAGDGLCVSFYTQGCPHRCKGCHNPETWSYDGGKEFKPELINQIIDGLNAQGIDRSLCILGGEPLCPENLFLVALLIKNIKEQRPHTKIYIWTGYLYEDLKNSASPHMDFILNNTDVLIDGPFIEELRDITLPLRGSTNQRVLYKNIDF